MLQSILLKETDVEPLAEGVFEVLARVGVLSQNQEILTALEAAGARVDHGAERAYFPRQMVAEHVESFRAQGGPETQFQPQTIRPGAPGIGGQVAQFFYDHEKKEARSSISADFITLTKLGEVLHGDGGVGHSLSLTDVPPLMEPFEAGLLLTEYATKPGAPFAWNVAQVDYLLEMGEILGIADWFSYGAICFAHPLRFDRDTAARFARKAREGSAIGLTAMPVAGATTPVTVEGFIVVSSAEHVATWIAARAINPDVPLGGSMWAGTVDMSTGHVSYSNFDAMYYAFASVEFLRRWCGMNVSVGGGEYCDAKAPGLYTALEKAYKAMTIAAFSGSHPSIGQGMLDEGKVVAPVQLLIERDLSAGTLNFSRAVDPSDGNIGLSAIMDVGIGLQKNHLQTEHTLRNFRSSLWLPELIDRSGWAGPEAEAEMLDKAQARVNDLVSQYKKPEGREDKLAAMRAVAERARKDLLG